jgi:hypothetical protein
VADREEEAAVGAAEALEGAAVAEASGVNPAGRFVSINIRAKAP